MATSNVQWAHHGWCAQTGQHWKTAFTQCPSSRPQTCASARRWAWPWLRSGGRGRGVRRGVRVARADSVAAGGAAGRAPQCLSGLAGVAGDLGHRGEQRREQSFGDPVANVGRQVGHLPRVGHQPAVILVGELLGAKSRQAQLGDHRRAPLGVEIRQVPRRATRPRFGEHQLLDHDPSSICPGRSQCSSVSTVQAATADGSIPSIRSIIPP